MPTNYYWWSVFYRKSAFEEWGVKPPTTWDEFMGLLDTLKGKGIAPLTDGTGSTPWMASGWFDYLDLRINGAAVPPRPARRASTPSTVPRSAR